ncbi:MAG: hypothetical protein QOF32_1937 [Gammaproteobacteria bacterium]|jgi:hypothetical protein|nr:hypothetical protein [Gammaproteobacteria bacterium]
MKVPRIPVILLVGLIAGCASQSSTKPVEVLDERSAVTVGALKEPIELVPGPQNVVLILRRRTSFAYLGPVEWNRSGVLSYGLWIHIAPGNDRQPGDIHASSAVTVVLDDGTLDLSVIDAPKLGREPYQPVASWGQTAYFGLTAETLRRMAASSKLVLDVRTVDGSLMSFTPTLDARAVLTQYAKDRGITGD